MFKKTLLASMIATAISVSTSTFAGFYAGPGIGVMDTLNNTSAFRGLTPRVVFGYEDVEDLGYFGVEAFATPGIIPMTQANAPGTATVKSSYNFGASILPGLVMGPQTVGFFRFGLITSRFSETDSHKTGAQLGVGLLTSVSPAWDIRGEYDYSIYGGVGRAGSPKSDEFQLTFIYRMDDL